MSPLKAPLPRRHSGRAESKSVRSTKSASICKSYHPYVNHAACIEHQLWWRNPALFGAAILCTCIALLGFTATFMLTPSHQMAVVPFAETPNLHRQAESEFQSLCSRGQSDISCGRLESGIHELRKAELIKDVDGKLKAELFNDIAITLHASGKSATSTEYLEKAVIADPKLIAARSNLAIVLLERGEKEKAIKVLEDALKLQPSNSCLAHRLSNLNGSAKLSM